MTIQRKPSLLWRGLGTVLKKTKPAPAPTPYLLEAAFDGQPSAAFRGLTSFLSRRR